MLPEELPGGLHKPPRGSNGEPSLGVLHPKIAGLASFLNAFDHRYFSLDDLDK